MEIESIHRLCNLEPFIRFEIVMLGEKRELEGYEYYCIDTECNCRVVNIIVYEKGEGEVSWVGNNKVLAQLIYGWKNYKYYLRQRFLKNDCESIVKGGLNFFGEKTLVHKEILRRFRGWIKENKKEKDRLFAERYKKFRELIAIREELFGKGDKNYDDVRILSDVEMIKVLQSLTQSDISNMVEMYRKIIK